MTESTTSIPILKPFPKKTVFLLLTVLIFLLFLFLAFMSVNARITHLQTADVYLEDLPASFDGTRLLFISDINISTALDRKVTAGLLNQLEQLNPDVLVLGGDYSTTNIFDSLFSSGKNKSYIHASDFIRGLRDFPSAMAKVAVIGEEDINNPYLLSSFDESGISLLYDSSVSIKKGNDRILIAGLSEFSLGQTPYEAISREARSDECIITIAHNPAAYLNIQISDTANGNSWADLVLCGHTLGGQVTLFGRTLHTLTANERRYLKGWHTNKDSPLLVSQGLGCKNCYFRYHSSSEVWLLILHPKSKK